MDLHESGAEHHKTGHDPMEFFFWGGGFVILLFILLIE